MIGSAWVIGRGVLVELVRKKDFYVLLVMLAVTMVALASQSFFQVQGVSRYVKDLGYTFITLFSMVISITVSARQLPEEIERRTIYPLLAKPVGRFEVIVGKFLGGTLASIISFTAFFAVYIVFFVIEGAGGQGMLLAQSYLFGILFLSLTSAIAVFFSCFLTVSANVTLSLLMYFAVSAYAGQMRDMILYSKGAASYAMGVVYYLIPHFDFYDLRIRLTHAWDPLAPWVVSSVAAYTLVYCSFLVYFSGRIFGRKQL